MSNSSKSCLRCEGAVFICDFKCDLLTGHLSSLALLTWKGIKKAILYAAEVLQKAHHHQEGRSTCFHAFDLFTLITTCCPSANWNNLWFVTPDGLCLRLQLPTWLEKRLFTFICCLPDLYRLSTWCRTLKPFHFDSYCVCC